MVLQPEEFPQSGKRKGVCSDHVSRSITGLRHLVAWTRQRSQELDWMDTPWETVRSRVWLFRGASQVVGVFSSLSAAGDWEKKSSYHSLWAGGYLHFHSVLVHIHTGRAQPSGHILERGAGHCSAPAPLMKPWCAEGAVPTAVNLKPLPEREIACGLAPRR